MGVLRGEKRNKYKGGTFKYIHLCPIFDLSAFVLITKETTYALQNEEAIRKSSCSTDLCDRVASQVIQCNSGCFFKKCTSMKNNVIHLNRVQGK